MSSVPCWVLDCNSYTNRVSLVLTTEKSGVKKTKEKEEKQEGANGREDRGVEKARYKPG